MYLTFQREKSRLVQKCRLPLHGIIKLWLQVHCKSYCLLRSSCTRFLHEDVVNCYSSTIDMPGRGIKRRVGPRLCKYALDMKQCQNKNVFTIFIHISYKIMCLSCPHNVSGVTKWKRTLSYFEWLMLTYG